MASPEVVAKGRGHVALRIREAAEQHDVPVVENPPLVDYLLEQLVAMHLAASLALARAGIEVVQDRCMMVEHRRLLSGSP